MSGRPMRGARAIALVAAAVTLGACHLGPDYRHPETATPAAWRERDAAQGAQWPAPDWWQGFGSTELNALMAETQRAHAHLGAAAARVKGADAQARTLGGSSGGGGGSSGPRTWRGRRRERSPPG